MTHPGPTVSRDPTPPEASPGLKTESRRSAACVALRGRGRYTAYSDGTCCRMLPVLRTHRRFERPGPMSPPDRQCLQEDWISRERLHPAGESKACGGYRPPRQPNGPYGCGTFNFRGPVRRAPLPQGDYGLDHNHHYDRRLLYADPRVQHSERGGCFYKRGGVCHRCVQDGRLSRDTGQRARQGRQTKGQSC